MDRVSVVLPVFNGAKTLVNCVSSIINQDYTNIEIIVVNDGSMDDSISILESYKDKLKVISQKNAGVSSARNKGVDAASGDIIAFIDQDDFWRLDKISKQVSCLDKDENISFVFSNFKRYDYIRNSFYKLSNSQLNDYIYEWPGRHYLSEKIKIINYPHMLGLLLKGYPIYPSTMLIKRDVIAIAGGWNQIFKRCQDLDLSMRCSKITNFCYIDECLTTIGRHETNVSNNFLDQLIEDIDVLEYHRSSGYFNEYEVKLIKYYLGKRLCGLGWHFSNIGDYGSSRSFYFKALRHRSGNLNGLINIPFTFPLLSFIKKKLSS